LHELAFGGFTDDCSSPVILQEHLKHINQLLFLDRNYNIGARGDAVCGLVLPMSLDSFGDKSFCHDHRLQLPYVGGSMAKGISSVAIVKALGQSGMLGFYGAAGLTLEQINYALDELLDDPELPFGCNLIHSPTEPELEKAIVDLYLQRDVRLVEASAFLALTLPLVRYRTRGIYRDQQGKVVTPNRLIAKISREEVAAHFFSPPPQKMLQQLVAAGELSHEQALMAQEIPMAQDITAEADSGGHTDNRPALALFPTILAQRDRFQQRYNYHQRLRVGLGGGIATPSSALAAFTMGAAYLVTGTINQACVESGTCDDVRKLLAETRQADITMAPSGDMFEMGVKVQVLKRGTMFAIRAHKLFELYRTYDSIESLPSEDRHKLEKTFFKTTCDDVWEQTRRYFNIRDPKQISKAEADPKYKMALIFRWYLGQTPVWANSGNAERKIDYQIWCGPAMGAFNEWVRGSFLDDPAERDVVTLAYNILYGAAVLQRVNQLRQQGASSAIAFFDNTPLRREQIEGYLK
jgi:PfaD family protein